MNHPQFANKLTEGRCGFYRTLGVTRPAGTMALAGCQDKKQNVMLVGEMAISQENTAICVGKVKKPDTEYPVARFAPGRKDRVISPYTGKEIDMQDIPGGTLVMDPDFPSEQKKFFCL